MSYYHGIIVSILQTISFNIITKILPKIIHILELQVDKQKQFREESENKIVTSISPDIKIVKHLVISYWVKSKQHRFSLCFH